MLLSIASIIILGGLAGKLCQKIKLPPLFGMICVGILIGPYGFHLLDANILNISGTIRQMALIIILIRAGLNLNLGDLKKVGRPAVLMCFVPALVEIICMTLLAPQFLELSYLEAAILGSVIAAVSPAVIVPKMISLMQEGYGSKQSIPQMILAGASVDDIFVIVLFTTFVGLAKGEKISVLRFVNIPISIIGGILLGLIVGYGYLLVIKKWQMKETMKAVVFLAIGFVLVTIEEAMTTTITFSALIAVMSMGIVIRKKDIKISERMAGRFQEFWSIAEIFLFVLVGACVDISYVKKAGLFMIVLLLLVLIGRMFGVLLCLIGTKLNKRERVFCMLAYTPKATVQAAIGSVPLSLGLACGNTVLTIAVLAILLTAPLGAFCIDCTYRKLLQK